MAKEGKMQEYNQKHIGRRVKKMEAAGRRRRRSKRRYIDAVEEDMRTAGMKIKDTGDGVRWKEKIRCSDH